MLSIFVTVKKMMRSLKRKLKEQGSSGYTCLGLLPDHGYPLGKTLIPAAICRNQGLNSSEVQGLQGSVLGMGRGSTPTRCHPRRADPKQRVSTGSSIPPFLGGSQPKIILCGFISFPIVFLALKQWLTGMNKRDDDAVALQLWGYS